jgi:hypothetical protein
MASLNNIHCGQMKATGMFGLLARVSWQAFTKDVQLPPQVLVAFPVWHPSSCVANLFPHCLGGGRVVQAMLVPPVLATPPAATPPDPDAPPFEPPLPAEPAAPELLPPRELLPAEEPGLELPPTTVSPPAELFPPEGGDVEMPPEATVPPLAEVVPPPGLLLAPPLLLGGVPPVWVLLVAPPAAPAAPVVPPALAPAPLEGAPPDPAGLSFTRHPAAITAQQNKASKPMIREC